jgi:leader peptidase (prepilin peptidase)/N-methyltransferase
MVEMFPFWSWAVALLVFAYGAAIGSFLNVCIWRLPRDESVVFPPSHCPHCDHRLGAKDLIPLLSQLWLRGRCRYCSAAISWRYFWVEMLTGAAFTILYLRFGLTFEMAMNALFVACLILIFFVDLEHYVIPDIAVFIGVAAGIAKDVYGMWQSGWSTLWQPVPFTDWAVPIPQSVLGALVGAGALYLLGLIASLAAGKEAMGMGDVFLLGAMGANLALPQLALAFLIAVCVGGVVAVLLWALRLRKRKDEVPFGPMLVVGTFTALVFGDVLIRGYLRAFGLAAA